MAYQAINIISELPIKKDVQAKRPMPQAHWIIVHNSAVVCPDSEPADKVKARIKAYANYHYKKSYTAGIQYHLIVDRDGRIWQSRSLDYWEHHASNSTINKDSFSVCVDMHGDKQDLTAKQAASLKAVLDERRKVNNKKIKGHREVASSKTPTSCPGKYVMAWLKKYLAGELDKPTDPVVPQPDPCATEKAEISRLKADLETKSVELEALQVKWTQIKGIVNS